MLILVAVAALRLLEFHRPVLITMFVWNIYHVSLQSAGILSIYRRLNGGPHSERRVAHLAILAINAAMAFWFIDRFAPLHELLIRVHDLAPLAVRAVTLPVAAGAFGVLLYRIGRRPRSLSLAEATFLISSVLLFHPYLWVESADLATLAMLMGHFIQYLAIVWLLNRRKYAGSTGSWHERFLGEVSARPGLILTLFGVIGLSFYAADKMTTALGAQMLYVIVWNSMALTHFYVDGLVWAFKQPYVRQSVGPYLTPAERIVTQPN